jgi:hypothetical protein
MKKHYPKSEELLPETFLEKYKGKQPKWGFSGLGYVIFKRTYSRAKENGQTEEWWETIARCIRGAQKIGAKYTKEEAERLYDYIFNLKCSFAGRSLWQLGTKTLDIIGGDSLLNCWVTKASEIEDFIFIFTESMLGGGVGVNIAREYTQELPRVKTGVHCYLKNTKDADFIIPDSKEGWADLWRKLLEAYLVTGKSFSYSTICIRTSGEPLKTFGGIAPGPKPLIDGAELLCKVLEARAGKKLRTQDVADMICIGGQVVKSGGVRRTALILGGDPDDIAYLELKRWDLGGIPNWRSNSNNSLMANKYSYILDKFWEGYKGNGEPYGLINLKNSRKFGRTGETKIDRFNLTDEDIIMTNPCGEATLHDKEACNLAELFLNNIESKEEMLDCAKLLYKTQKAISAMPYYHKESTDVIHKNMRLGLGVTGIAQKIDQFESWCDYTYKNLRKFDKEWSKENKYPQSIRLTVVKPSGTLSLLSGSTPGGHPGFSEYHIRRVRFSSNDPLLPRLKTAGYNIEPEIRFDGTKDYDISIVEFPAMFDSGTLLEENCGTIKQLEIVKSLQKYWADQAVSVTTYYRKEEIPDIKKWLEENYDNNVKTLSFLLKSEHGFVQPPLEVIEKVKYEQTVSKLKPIQYEEVNGHELLDSQECESGACPIK